MRPLSTPLHSGLICGRQVRFFRSPLSGPDFPWHSVDDLHLALNFPRELRRHFKAMLQRDWGGKVRTIATRRGVTTIAPHPMAQGLIESLEDFGGPPSGAADDYARTAGEALQTLTASMPPDEAVRYSMAAFNRGGGL